MAPLQRLDLLAPEIWASEGGIQIYTRTLLRALRQIRPQVQLRVFIRNDQAIPTGIDPLFSGIDWYPCAGSIPCLIWRLLRANWRRPSQLLLSTHPNFAPLVLFQHHLSGAGLQCGDDRDSRHCRCGHLAGVGASGCVSARRLGPTLLSGT